MSTTSDRSRIGITVPGESFTVTPEVAAKYADATGDENPRYRGTAAVAPPMSAVIHGIAALMPAAMPAIGDPMRLMKLLHGEHEVRWSRVVKAGETLATSGTVQAITDKGSGELLEVVTRANGADGATAVEMTWGLFIRGSSKGEKKPAEAAPVPKPERPAPAFEVSWKVAADQPVRYAEASGDRNPIHVDENIAKMAGFKGCILHGLCTMAFAQRAIVDRAAGGDPARLKRMKVRFTKPVYPGDTLTTSAWIVEKHGDRTLYGFEVRTQDGTTVLEQGSADVV